MIDRKWIGHELPPTMLAIERSRLQSSPMPPRNPPEYLDVAAARAAGYGDIPHRRPF